MPGFKWFSLISVIFAVFLVGCYGNLLEKQELYVVYADKASDLYEAQIYLQYSGVKLVKKAKYANSMVVSELPSENFKETFGSFVKVEPLIEMKASLLGCAKKPDLSPLPEQPKQIIPWGIKAVNAIEAWKITRGVGVVVCVVDTGLDYNHPDMLGNVAGGENMIDPEEDYFDDHDHGTHVSGTIAGRDNDIGIVGVAPESKIYAVKVLNSWGSGSSQDVADGILACVNYGADIINMSLGSNRSSGVISSAVKQALSAGIVVVAAAGNNGSGKVGYPAALDGVIAISATDPDNELASFSQYGPEINFAAPGVDILSSLPNGLYDSFNGTSMATPHVAGVAALMIAAGQNKLKGVDIGLDIEKQGSGLIDALKTVKGE